MFLPESVDDKKKADERRKLAYKNIEEWCLQLIPEKIRSDVQISTQEVICGDPECAPIDTAVTIIFSSGGDGVLGFQMEAYEVTQEEVENKFPTKTVLEKWHKGEEAEWPPYDASDVELPELRFTIGTKVFCRIGPDAETDWAPGEIVELWYTEKTWPPGSFAPYKIKLDDGRQIFAPGDMDAVVKKQPE